MKILGIVLIFLLSLLIWISVYQYFFCPRFIFEEPLPFQGQHLYNPYQNIDSSAWNLCNFHAHSSAWKGLTNGKGTAQDIWNVYDSLGYAVHLVSNYQKIDRAHEFATNFIPAYEHGFNINKAHYLVLGETVHWLDYLLPQIPSNKQWILNRLTEQKENLVIVNHPDLRNGITREDVKYLSGFHCMEILSPYSNSVAKWDSALSTGKPIFLVGSDDTHDIFDIASVGRYCTVVNASIPSRVNIVQALKTGNSYGMKIPEIPRERFGEKIIRFKNGLPRIKSYTVNNSTIELVLDRTAKEIIFYGQYGQELARINSARKALYTIKDSDPYVRSEVTYSDGTMVYLNPIFRYGESPFKGSLAVIDQAKSKFLGTLGILILLVWGFAVYALVVKNYWKPSIRKLPEWLPNPQRG